MPRGCVRVAFTLYSEILTEIERNDYQIFGSADPGRAAAVAPRSR